MLFFPPARVVEGDNQIVGCRGVFGRLAVDAHVLDLEIYRIELELGNVVAQRRNIFSRFSSNRALVEIEPQVRSNILQVIIAAPGVRFVRPFP